MILKEFLSDIKIVSDFLNSTDLVGQIRTCATIAEGAKSGTETDWRTVLSNKFDEINDIVLGFESKNATLLIENTYLKASNDGGLITNYREAISRIFEDIITADAQTTALAEQLQTFKTHTEQILGGFQTVGVELPQLEASDLNLAMFEFKYSTDISNLKELSGTSRLLNMHLRSICKLDLTIPTTDIEISVVSKSSPLAIKAWLSKKTADVLNKIISDGLENFKKIQELRSMSESIRQQKLDTRGKKLELALQQRRAELEIQVIDNITNQLMRRFPDDSQNGTKNEVEVGVKKAVDYFITQTSKGLEIRVLPTASDITSDEQGKTVIQKYQHKLEEAEEILKQLPERIEADTETEPEE